MEFIQEGYKKAKIKFEEEQASLEIIKANEVTFLETIISELNTSLFNKNASSIPSILKRAAEEYIVGNYKLPSEFLATPVADVKTIWVACIFNFWS